MMVVSAPGSDPLAGSLALALFRKKKIAKFFAPCEQGSATAVVYEVGPKPLYSYERDYRRYVVALWAGVDHPGDGELALILIFNTRREAIQAARQYVGSLTLVVGHPDDDWGAVAQVGDVYIALFGHEHLGGFAGVAKTREEAEQKAIDAVIDLLARVPGRDFESHCGIIGCRFGPYVALWSWEIVRGEAAEILGAWSRSLGERGGE